MLLTNAPAKLPLPFSASGTKNTIPTASQIGITPGAASLTDGFPPLTRTPLAAGGVPPSGADMNGILYELSAIVRWVNAGGGYPYDSTFAADANVLGYPKGARVLRSDGLGYWFNTVDANQVDPEAAAGAGLAAGWVPDFTTGATAVTMTNANVTLTALQYGKPIVIISGALVSNLNLIFPAVAGEWVVINNTTGAFKITCKTASGSGVVVYSAQKIVGDGTNILSAEADAIAMLTQLVAQAGGTADALTATLGQVPRVLVDGLPVLVRAASANATSTPTFTPNSGTIAAATIVKGNNLPLAAGDIAGAGHWLELNWDATLSKWVLANPATGVASTSATVGVVGTYRNLQTSAPGVSANVSITADEVLLENTSNAYITARNVALTLTASASGLNGLDTGTLATSTWYYIWLVHNGSVVNSLLSLSSTAPTMPGGYTYKARIGALRTDASGNKYPLAYKQVGNKVRYVVGSTNVPSLPLMTSGASGTWSPTTAPTWVALGVGSVLPPTAVAIDALLCATYGNAASSNAALAPNASYSGVGTTNPPPFSTYTGGTGVLSMVPAHIVLESTNIYFVAQAAGGALMCVGWQDNI